MELILSVAALILGAISVIEARGRSWAGLGVVCLSAIHLLGNIKL